MRTVYHCDFHLSNLAYLPSPPNRKNPLFFSTVSTVSFFLSFYYPSVFPSFVALYCVLTCVASTFSLTSSFLLPASASSPDSTVCCTSPPLRVSAALHSQTGSQPSQWDTHFSAAARTAGNVCAGSVLLCINMLTRSHVK